MERLRATRFTHPFFCGCAAKKKKKCVKTTASSRLNATAFFLRSLKGDGPFVHVAIVFLLDSSFLSVKKTTFKLGLPLELCFLKEKQSV